MKSTGLKITAIMLCVVLLGITVTVGVAVTTLGNVIKSESLDKIQGDTDRQALTMNEWLVYHKATVSATAAVLSQISDFSPESLRSSLREVLESNEVYQDVYIRIPDQGHR